MRKALFIARLQPLHLGHEHAIKKALENFDKLVIGIGSSQYKRTARNPFSFAERRKMIHLCLGKKYAGRYKIIPVPDFFDDQEWREYCIQRAEFDVVITGSEWTARCFRGIKKIVQPTWFHPEIYNATKIRKLMAAGERWEHLVPAKVARCIKGLENVKDIWKNVKRAKAKDIISFIKRLYPGQRYHEDEFKVLISCILSQRTREENTDMAAKKLFAVADTPAKILRLQKKELENLIKSAGFYRQKAENIKRVCKILLSKYGGRVPKDRELLLKLPGVGFKTADVTLCYGFGMPTIPVDVHVSRVSKRIGLVKKDAGPEEVRKVLEEIIPASKRHVVNLGFVRFGRKMCLPRNPKCQGCPFTCICDYYFDKYLK